MDWMIKEVDKKTGHCKKNIHRKTEMDILSCQR